MKSVRFHLQDTDEIDAWVKFLWNTNPSWCIFGDALFSLYRLNGHVVRTWFQARAIADEISRMGD